MNFLRPKNIFATFSPIYKLNGRRFISCHIKFQMTPICVCSNIKYWTIFYIWINDFLFLTKKHTKLCSYCKLQDETISHIFVECKFAIRLWSDLRHYCQNSFVTSILNPQSDLGILWNWSRFSNTFKPHTTITQILYLFVKRLIKAFI